MTCKDCIHYDVCHRRINSIDFLPVIKGKVSISSIMYKKCDDVEKHCLHFKDKSRIIEPTLNVGEKVWFLHRSSNEICEATVTRVEYNYFTNPQEWIEIEYISSSIGKLTYKTRIDLMLGKVVFFTKEEAEAKLKELNNENSI
jgi:hypothetical protein